MPATLTHCKKNIRFFIYLCDIFYYRIDRLHHNDSGHYLLVQLGQSLLWCLPGDVNVGSIGQRDMNQVIMDRNFPRESAQTLAMIEVEEFDHSKQ